LTQPLRRRDLHDDPVVQFSRWFEAASESGAPVPEAVALATATPEGRPSARMVLMKGFDERGFVFHTNLGSRKALELDANRLAALLFYWQELGRQIRVEGSVARLAEPESEAYFRSRPTRSRLAAWASPQSRVIESRAALEERLDELSREHASREVPRPSFWGGFLLTPSEFEFWQHGEDRLHDRFRYRRCNGSWTIERLAP